MLARWWRHYWIGLWILLAGPAVAVFGLITAKLALHYGSGTVESGGFQAFWASLWLGGALMAAGLGVWAYKFHTEDRAVRR